jgi:hypothetical protein
LLALIDADILCYEIGFVSEQVSYSIDGKHYETVTEAKKDGVQKEELTRHVYPIKWPFAKKMVDDRIKGILEAVGADDYKCYLTGKGNFRNDVATILKYKGTRHAPKPYHYQNIWDHLVGKYNAEVITGMEADDAISIAQHQSDERTVICSRDKDLRMVPGFHYSWQCGDRQPEKPLYEISEFQGHYNWAYQMLVGDTVDNIWGVPGIGPVKAAKLLADCDDDWDFIAVVMNVYKDVFGTEVIKYQSWDGRWLEAYSHEIYKENHLLLWMLRDVKEIPV